MTDLSTITGNTSANITITTGTEADRLAIASPTISSIFYQTNGINPGVYIYNGTQWTEKGGITDISNLITGTISKDRLPDSGVTPNTYTKVTIDSKGRAVSGTTPTTLAGYGITDAAQLDGNGKILLSAFPSSVVGSQQYLGFWNANTNTPTLANGVGVSGNFYMITANGSTNLDGTSSWTVGDLVIFDGTKWNRVPDVATQMFSSLVVGDTTMTTLPNDRVVFTSDGKLASSTNITFSNDALHTKQLVVSSDSTKALDVMAPLTPILNLTSSKNQTGTGLVIDSELGRLSFAGWNGTEIKQSSYINAVTSEAWGTNAGSGLGFYVVKNSTTAPIKALTIQHDKIIKIESCIKEPVNKFTDNHLVVDLSLGSTHKLTTSNVAMTNGVGFVSITLPSAAELAGITLTIMVQYSGVHGIHWTTPIKWAEKVEPIPTAVDGAVDIFTFFSDGDNVYGGSAGQSY